MLPTGLFPFKFLWTVGSKSGSNIPAPNGCIQLAPIKNERTVTLSRVYTLHFGTVRIRGQPMLSARRTAQALFPES